MQFISKWVKSSPHLGAYLQELLPSVTKHLTLPPVPRAFNISHTCTMQICTCTSQTLPEQLPVAEIAQGVGSSLNADRRASTQKIILGSPLELFLFPWARSGLSTKEENKPQ